jgi:hypothetical protein
MVLGYIYSVLRVATYFFVELLFSELGSDRMKRIICYIQRLADANYIYSFLCERLSDKAIVGVGTLGNWVSHSLAWKS